MGETRLTIWAMARMLASVATAELNVEIVATRTMNAYVTSVRCKDGPHLPHGPISHAPAAHGALSPLPPSAKLPGSVPGQRYTEYAIAVYCHDGHYLTVSWQRYNAFKRLHKALLSRVRPPPLAHAAAAARIS